MRTKGTAHADTKQRILQVARKIVIKDGHAKLSLRGVARELGVAAPTLYEYFDSKQAIVDTIANEIASSLRLALLRAAESPHDPRHALAAIGAEYVAWARKHPQDFMLLFARLPSKRRSLSTPAPPTSPYQVVLAAVGAAAAAGIVENGRENIEHTAYALWALAHGMAMLQLTHLAGFDADFGQVDRAAFTALTRGYSPD
ncbi:MAG TPA: TetR/AcrR family transcriptional regulator [Kofleriaceae bacterium]|nr:TetR/AcrR family transcriptional regulator [Kofleriaceae bacterium]